MLGDSNHSAPPCIDLLLAEINRLTSEVARLNAAQTRDRHADLDLAESNRRLCASEERYRTLVENVPGAIYRCAPDELATMEFLSEAIADIVGYPASDFLHNRVRPFVSLIHPEDRELEAAAIAQALRLRRPYILEYRLVHASGEIRWVYEKGQGIFAPDGTLQWLDGVLFDITDRRHLEDQLRHAQKLEALGRITGGIAHDFNNLLTPIIGFSDLLLQGLGTDDLRARMVTQIRQAAHRGADLVKQLLVFGRAQPSAAKPMDAHDHLRQMQDLLALTVGGATHLRFDLGAARAAICMDPTHFQQVILNLAVNARDAMPQGGELIVATALGEPEPPAGQSDPPDPDMLYITVTDTGTGMSPEVLERIFNPFYTTKPAGQGTGLGLFVARGLVREAGGTLEAASLSGRGSSFTISIPLASCADSAAASSAANLPPLDGDGTILLVEDEQSVREFTAIALREFGYHVLPASNGADALRLAMEHEGPIDLLLTDVVIPHLSGPELAERLLMRFPHLKVLYVSGYAPHHSDSRTPADVPSPLVAKPYSLETLAAAVHSLLSDRAGALDPGDRLRPAASSPVHAQHGHQDGSV